MLRFSRMRVVVDNLHRIRIILAENRHNIAYRLFVGQRCKNVIIRRRYIFPVQKLLQFPFQMPHIPKRPQGNEFDAHFPFTERIFKRRTRIPDRFPADLLRCMDMAECSIIKIVETVDAYFFHRSDVQHRRTLRAARRRIAAFSGNKLMRGQDVAFLRIQIRM